MRASALSAVPTGTSAQSSCLEVKGERVERLERLATGAERLHNWDEPDDEEEHMHSDAKGSTTRVSVPQAPSEAPEPEDPLIKLGEEIGSAGRGRASFQLHQKRPRRWSREGASMDDLSLDGSADGAHRRDCPSLAPRTSPEQH